MKSLMPRGAVALLVLWLAATGCSFLSGMAGTPTATPQSNARATAAALAAQPIDAPLPSANVPVPVTAGRDPQWSASANGHCRSGPGIQYESVDLLWSGEQLAAVGINADASWVQLRLPLSLATCWTQAAGGTFQGRTGALRVEGVSFPVPTPTLPNPMRRGSDLDVLRVAASPMQASGIVYLDVRNNGPEDFSAQVRILCFATSRLRRPPFTLSTDERQASLRLTLAAGATTTINTDLATDAASYSYPSIDCVLTAFQKHDLNPINNSNSSSVP